MSPVIAVVVAAALTWWAVVPLLPAKLPSPA